MLLASYSFENCIGRCNKTQFLAMLSSSRGTHPVSNSHRCPKLLNAIVCRHCWIPICSFVALSVSASQMFTRLANVESGQWWSSSGLASLCPAPARQRTPQAIRAKSGSTAGAAGDCGPATAKRRAVAGKRLDSAAPCFGNRSRATAGRPDSLRVALAQTYFCT